MWLKRKYLIILQTLWETLTEQRARIDKSVETIRLDIVIAAILELVSKGTEIKACLNLANSLLSRGGKQVQKHFLIALSQRGQPEIFFRQLETCIEIAAEEGPNLGNILAVLQTGIIESINSIVRKSHTDIDGVYYPQEYLDKVRELKESVVTNMLAMMEASTIS